MERNGRSIERGPKTFLWDSRDPEALVGRALPVPIWLWWWFEIAFPPNAAFPPNDPPISRENSGFSVSLRAFFEMKDPK